ncbi:hypothetical protein SAMN04490188_4948 [Pseudomonas kilonensis]|uniref:Uncharacterized protein n=1 Tax=Pseudomonas kilonensis TaxID=132476 RepID=A0ABY0ZGX1_9PSED|nr:hypothetical protein SAMN04490188_4948 [Pseudomonas kilonensis]
MSNQLGDKPHCSILSLPGSTQFQPDPKAWFLKTSIHQPLVTAHALLPPATFNGHPLHQAMERTTPPSTRIAAPVVALA